MANDPIRDARSAVPAPAHDNGRAVYLLAFLVLLGGLLLAWLGWKAVAVRERRVAQDRFRVPQFPLAAAEQHADDGFVHVRPVDLCSIKEGHATIDGGADQRLRQSRIVIGEDDFEPAPFGSTRGIKPRTLIR